MTRKLDGLALDRDLYNDRYWRLTHHGVVVRRGRGWHWGRLWLALYRLRLPREDQP